LSELEIELEDNTLILARELNDAGKGVCRVNGVAVTAATLKSVSDCIIDIHGQHEHQSLLDSKQHIQLLDAFDGRITSQKLQVQDRFEALMAVRRRLSEGFLNEGERMRRLDVLRYQINEIEAARLVEGELEELAAERQILANAGKIMEALDACGRMLDDGDAGALPTLRAAADKCGEISGYAGEFRRIHEQLDGAYYEAQEAASALRSQLAAFEFDPGRLEAVEFRLDALAQLRRKYGDTIGEIVAFLAQARAQLEELESSSALRERLAAEEGRLAAAYAEAAQELSALRKEAAGRLEADILGQLRDLGLLHARFEVRFETLDKPAATGLDVAEFYLSANAGEPLKPLDKVASGGEVSRIMLALKSILAGIDQINTMIFDEIDSGISGRIAGVVGEKLLALSAARQVVCVTHLAQIAALADAHYLVLKQTEGNSTKTSLVRLDAPARVEQIAGLMDADGASKAAVEHARELVKFGESLKLERNSQSD